MHSIAIVTLVSSEAENSTTTRFVHSLTLPRRSSLWDVPVFRFVASQMIYLLILLYDCYSTETKDRVSLADKALVDSAKRGDMKRFVDAHLKGANILQTDSDGMTVLHNAARFNYKDIVQYILVNGPPGIVDMLDKEK